MTIKKLHFFSLVQAQKTAKPSICKYPKASITPKKDNLSNMLKKNGGYNLALL
jgi:hypothetical protein